MQLLGRADATLRGMCGVEGAAGGIIIYNIVEPERMQQLRDLGMVGRRAKQVSTVMMKDVIKLCKHLGNMDALLADLNEKFHTAKAPPPVRHSPSSWGLPQLLSPTRETATASRGLPALEHSAMVAPRTREPSPPWHSRAPASALRKGGASPPITSLRLTMMAPMREQEQHAAALPLTYPPPLISAKKYVFPSELPDVVLLPEQQSERYALEFQPLNLRREAQQFLNWSSAPINTERSARYTKAVQSTTLDRVPNKLWGFLGYTAGFYNLSRDNISLQLYANPRYMARFVAYLKARDVGIGYIRAHMGVARKVNDYLQSGAEEGSEVQLHAAKMDKWLMTLEAQLAASIQRTIKSGVPDIQVTWRWVEALCEAMLVQVDAELRRSDSISHATAVRVQQAVLAALVTGCYCPPCRLHVLQTMIHPKFNGRLACLDRDCMNGRGCMGNHLLLGTIAPPAHEGQDAHTEDEEGADHEEGANEQRGGGSSSAISWLGAAEAGGSKNSWAYFDYATTEISNVIVHHKNDR